MNFFEYLSQRWTDIVPLLIQHAQVVLIAVAIVIGIGLGVAIEGQNARYRRAVRARGHFPNEPAALKCLYLVSRSLDPTGKGATRWTMRWKPALNVFAIVFEGRWPTAEKY